MAADKVTPVTEDANANASQLHQRADDDYAAQHARPDESHRDDAHPAR